ncbi:hypothetical protein [Streptomyces sp. NBC_00576]|uniref:hypothetical protein n=1 Tax=Streptomyces sp. NBC_00576 TaxID=2903665 RepID=UPI002E81DFF9|nr:hypothetical protein [Streptomyces sp. NBC_00576]WUB74674.1 hypothetical protein OG734_34070 [Streptomyces sp. NBC_00576]
MAYEHSTSRSRPGHRAAVAAVLLTALGTAALTGCGGSAKNTATQETQKTQDKATGTAAPSADPSTATTAPPAESTPTPPATPTAQAAAKTSAASSPAADSGADSAATPGCDHKMPISPDEVAVYRYTPEGGSLNLIVKAGAWGCPDPDADGPAFETTGKEYDLPLDQAAYITATNPITESSENQHIGVQELLDWLETHPNSGLVFKYHAGADGTVDKLEQEFTP